MGEIADSMIDGTFDMYTGEYLGEGQGFPRSRHEKQHHSLINQISGVRKYLVGAGYIGKKARREVLLAFHKGIDTKQASTDELMLMASEKFNEFKQFVKQLKQNNDI